MTKKKKNGKFIFKMFVQSKNQSKVYALIKKFTTSIIGIEKAKLFNFIIKKDINPYANFFKESSSSLHQSSFQEFIFSLSSLRVQSISNEINAIFITPLS